LQEEVISMICIYNLFYDVDNFCNEFEPVLNKSLIDEGKKQRIKESSLALSEVMTIVILFHSSNFRHFKGYYTEYVTKYMKDAFPGLVSYNRFVELMQTALLPLCCYLQTRKGRITGISFVDSTPIIVCHSRRVHSHKVFKKLAKTGKNSVGRFYGFKLHIVINECEKLSAFKLTPGNTDDRKPVPDMVRGLSGKIFGDRGYISQKLFEDLFEEGIQLITKIRKNMKNRLIPLIDKILLRKRAVIESVSDQLKNISQIEHTRHRSIANFMVNLISGLIAYTWKPNACIFQSSVHGTDIIII
jgi:hypothetical protein